MKNAMVGPDKPAFMDSCLKSVSSPKEIQSLPGIKTHSSIQDEPACMGVYIRVLRTKVDNPKFKCEQKCVKQVYIPKHYIICFPLPIDLGLCFRDRNCEFNY